MPAPAPRFPGAYELLESLWREWTGVLPRMRQVLSLQTAMPLVAGGIGVSLMPETALQFPRSHTVIRRLKQHVPPMHAAVLWTRGNGVSPLQRRFLDLVLALGDEGESVDAEGSTA